jgi:hypothetical protein
MSNLVRKWFDISLLFLIQFAYLVVGSCFVVACFLYIDGIILILSSNVFLDFTHETNSLWCRSWDCFK